VDEGFFLFKFAFSPLPPIPDVRTFPFFWFRRPDAFFRRYAAAAAFRLRSF